jgi:hypothetical protein
MFLANRDPLGAPETWFGDDFVRLLVLFVGLSDGMLISTAASRAPGACKNKARGGRLVAFSIAGSLALGSVLGAGAVGLVDSGFI